MEKRIIRRIGHNVPLKDRFEHYAVPVTECGCWLWTARVNRKGYGFITAGGKAVTAHRMSWLLYKGDVPDGLFVLHKCDVPGCVNPDHLFLGTHQDNMDDMKSKGRAKGGCNKGKKYNGGLLKSGLKGNWPSGTDNHNAKITMGIAEQIRASYPSLSYQKIANKFGLNVKTVFRIVKGLNWKVVPNEGEASTVGAV